jgi:hypothetical protein
MEVKLSPSDYARWYMARRDRDLLTTGKRRTEKPKGTERKDEKPKGVEGKHEKPKGAEGKDEKPVAESKPSKERSNRPLVDKQLEKALAVIKEKLEAPVATK